jgi:hypothetical protein
VPGTPAAEKSRQALQRGVGKGKYVLYVTSSGGAMHCGFAMPALWAVYQRMCGQWAAIMRPRKRRSRTRTRGACEHKGTHSERLYHRVQDYLLHHIYGILLMWQHLY